MKKWLTVLIAGAAIAATGCDKDKQNDGDAPTTAAQQEPGEQGTPTDDQASETEEAGAEEAEEAPSAADEADPMAPPENVAAPPEDAEKTDSGMAYVVLEEGSGEKPSATSTVTIHYTGWTTDGKMFDSSHKRGEPATFPLPNLIKGWQEGVPMMKKGAKWRFWIPAELAYGDNPRPGAPKGQLTFDIELVDFEG